MKTFPITINKMWIEKSLDNQSVNVRLDFNGQTFGIEIPKRMIQLDGFLSVTIENYINTAILKTYNNAITELSEMLIEGIKNEIRN